MSGTFCKEITNLYGQVTVFVIADFFPKSFILKSIKFAILELKVTGKRRKDWMTGCIKMSVRQYVITNLIKMYIFCFLITDILKKVTKN